MDNQNNRINPFVNNEGFSVENNLVDILGNNDDNEKDQVISQVKLSTYLDTHELSDKLYQAKSKLSILNLNAQSIMAKFDEFQIAIDQKSEVRSQKFYLNIYTYTKLSNIF